jgi:hypothetical protein
VDDGLICLLIKHSKWEGVDVALGAKLHLDWNEEVAKERTILGG